MGSRFKELLSTVIGQLTSNMAAGPLAEVVGMLATSGAAAIAPLKLAESAGYLALFLGTAFIQDCRARKASAEQQMQLKHLEAAVRRGDRETLAVLAAQQEWIRQAIENGPEAFRAAWRKQTEKLLGGAGVTSK